MRNWFTVIFRDNLTTSPYKNIFGALIFTSGWKMIGRWWGIEFQKMFAMTPPLPLMSFCLGHLGRLGRFGRVSLCRSVAFGMGYLGTRSLKRVSQPDGVSSFQVWLSRFNCIRRQVLYSSNSRMTPIVEMIGTYASIISGQWEVICLVNYVISNVLQSL